MDDKTEISKEPSAWERSSTRRFLRWLFSARTWRRGLITLAWAAAVIALVYGVLDWRARQAWNEFRQGYEARMASLDLKTYTPKEIPDADNFAATPFAQEFIKSNGDTNFLYYRDAWSHAANLMADPPKTPEGGHYQPRFEDLVAWQEAFASAQSNPAKKKDSLRTDQLDLASRAAAAPAILNGMKDDDAAFDDLRAGSVRPESRFPIFYNYDDPWSVLLPHLAKVKQTCRRLQLRACAELAAGQSENAWQDVKLGLYIADSVKTEPILISYLVRLSCVDIMLRPVWEGIAEHRWNEAQLQQLQDRLASCNWIADIQRPLFAEGSAGVLTVDLMRRRGLGMLTVLESYANGPRPTGLADQLLDDPHVLNGLGWILPASWYDREKINYATLFEREFQGSTDPVARRVFPRKIAGNATNLLRIAQVNENQFMALGTAAHGRWHAVLNHEIMAALLLPSMIRLPIKAAKIQVETDEAVMACALERYRLAHGQYPENPAALVPRFLAQLPNDVITGEPYKYHRTDDGRFVLYSVGWNETDDGGVPGSQVYDESAGDWVWPFPASS